MRPRGATRLRRMRSRRLRAKARVEGEPSRSRELMADLDQKLAPHPLCCVLTLVRFDVSCSAVVPGMPGAFRLPRALTGRFPVALPTVRASADSALSPLPAVRVPPTPRPDPGGTRRRATTPRAEVGVGSCRGHAHVWHATHLTHYPSWHAPTELPISGDTHPSHHVATPH